MLVGLASHIGRCHKTDRRFSPPQQRRKARKGVRLMSVYEALTLMIAFAIFVVAVLDYKDNRK
jgi:hypothetical protein